MSALPSPARAGREGKAPAAGAGTGVPAARAWCRVAVFFAWTVLMAFFFAHVEIQIEGGAGWAASLPTWRIEKHWLLDLFWGGRAMTGYHAWAFSFMALVFCLPMAFNARWRWSEAALALAGLALFWVIEDFLWFVINPAFGLARFTPDAVPWHPRWLLGLPVDYWWGGIGAGALAWLHVRVARREPATGPGRR